MTERRAIGQALVAVAAGVGNNAFVRALAELPVMQLVLLRAGGALVVLIPVLIWRGLRWPSRFALLRAGVEAAATILLMWALALTSLGFVATISLVIPLGVMFFGAVLMGERLTRRGQGLVLAGFAGALIATTPKLDGNAMGALAALGSAACFILRDLMTRRHGGAISGLEMSATASLMTAAVALLAGGAAHWQPIDAGQAAMVAAMVVLYVLSNLLIVMATQGGRPALVAATRYSSILWAMLADLVLFATAPRPATLIGATIIVVSGLALVRTERVPR
jgi:drug/metabolite transporter (DMT)-like permease